jgi:hypothetical protein
LWAGAQLLGLKGISITTFGHESLNATPASRLLG